MPAATPGANRNFRCRIHPIRIDPVVVKGLESCYRALARATGDLGWSTIGKRGTETPRAWA